VRVRRQLISGLALLAAMAAPASAFPSDPPPWQASDRMAPPAWVETSHGDRWLAFASAGCWFDPPLATPPPCPAPIPVSALDLTAPPPEIPVVAGEVVRFHLSLAPGFSLTLRGAGSTAPLATQTADWTVTPDAGRMLLDVGARNGLFSYQANFALYADIPGEGLARRLPNGRFDLLLPDGTTMTTHGPDPGPPDDTTSAPTQSVPRVPVQSTATECAAWGARVTSLTGRMRHVRTLAGLARAKRRHRVTLALRRLADTRAGYLALLQTGCDGKG
jgi:hypothetical protein